MPGNPLAATACDLVTALRPLTDLPLLVGVGIGTPDQAAEACAFADGVIVGSALMARLVEGERDGRTRAGASVPRRDPTLRRTRGIPRWLRARMRGERAAPPG